MVTLTARSKKLTVKSLAEYYRVDRSTITRWAKNGLIKHTKTPGGKPRLTDSDFAEVDCTIKLLTAREVAQIFRVGLRSAERWFATGKLSSILAPGGLLRCDEQTIRTLLGLDQDYELATVKLIKITEIAAQCGVSKDKIRRRALSEGLNQIKSPGNHIYYWEDQTARLIEFFQ